MWVGVFFMVSASHSAEYLTTNSMVNWMYPSLLAVLGAYTSVLDWRGYDHHCFATAVGVGVMTGLRRAHLPQVADSMEK